MIRVHVAVDNRLVRDVFSDAFSREPGINLVRSSVEGSAGAEIAAALRPDVIVMCDQFGEPPEESVALYREVSPGSKVELMPITKRAADLSADAGADRVVDAADGVSELIAMVRRVVRL